MAMNKDHFHTHGPDELAMLRAECDKWHKAYDRISEEHMRFADRAIELEKDEEIDKQKWRGDEWAKACNQKDKEIAELKEEIEEQKRLRDMALASVPNALKVMKIIQHQKYKRCLAMAEWCDAEADVADADGDYEDMRWYQKWHERWLALAKKFKEAK